MSPETKIVDKKRKARQKKDCRQQKAKVKKQEVKKQTNRIYISQLKGLICYIIIRR